MKRLCIFFLLFAGVANADDPIVDPADYFVGWPWIDNLNKTWKEVDDANHIVKQLWYSLEDRCRAVGDESNPSYYKNYCLDGAYVTNWSYTNWAYWGSHPLVTNNVMTNYTPRMQGTISTGLWNQITNFVYKYPATPGSGSGMSNGNGYVFFNRPMFDAIRASIEIIAPAYLPVSAPTYPWTNGPMGYVMAGLLIDAGYADSTSNVVSNVFGVVTSGDWEWITISNSVSFLASLDQMAACISQLKKVWIPAVSCAPYYMCSHAAIGPDLWNWGGVFESKYIITNLTDSRCVGQWPFAWMQQSLDETWASTFELTPTTWALTGDPSWSTNLDWYIGHQTDWKSNGWFGYANVDLGFSASLNCGETESNVWKVTAFEQSFAGTNTTSFSGSILYRAEIGWFTNGQGIIEDEFWHNYYFIDTEIPAHYENTYANWRESVDTSTYEQYQYTVTRIVTDKVETAGQDYDIITTGRYTSHTNINNSVQFTNTITPAADRYGVIRRQTDYYYSNMTAFSYIQTTNETISGSYWVDTYIDTEIYGGGAAHTNSGSLSVDGSTFGDSGVWCYHFAPTIRTATTNLWNAEGTGTLYVVGGAYGSSGDHFINTYSRAEWEWASEDRYRWDADDANESDYIGGVITTNYYTNLLSVTLPSGLETDDNGFYTLYYTNFAMGANDYVPYLNKETYPRMFWAVSNAFWVFDYTFPSNHF